MELLKGKRIVIIGVANERSLAWGIARQMKAQGARLAFSYLNEKLKEKIETLGQEVGGEFYFPLDVSVEDHWEGFKDLLKEKWGEVDVVVHSIAFASRQALSNPFSQTSKSDFLQAMDISAYSLVSICQHLLPLLTKEGSVMALTYYGSQKVVPHYNVMGVAKAALESCVRYLAWDLGREKNIRVNAISAGPIRTLSSSVISGIRGMLEQVSQYTPLRRTVNIDDVGGLGAFLASDLSRNISGQTLFVDAGESIVHSVGGGGVSSPS